MAQATFEGLTGEIVGKVENSNAPGTTDPSTPLKGEVVGKLSSNGGTDSLGPGYYGSIFGQFNESVAKLPDTVINLAMLGMEKAGIIDTPPPDSLDHRDYLNRIFNAANFDQKKQILGFLNIGTGGYKTPQSMPERIAGAAGQGMAMIVPMLGAQVAGTRGGTYVGEQAKRLINQQWAKAVDDSTPVLNEAGEVVRGSIAKPFAKTQATTQQLIRDGVQGLAEAPKKVLAGEVAAAAGSGALGQAEEETLGVRTGLGDLAGGMPGAVVAPAAKAGWSLLSKYSPTINGAKWLAEKAQPAVDFAVSRFKNPEGQVRGILGEQLDKAYQESLKRGDLQRTQEIIQAFKDAGIEPPKFTPAESTLDNVLIVGQKRVQATSTGDLSRQNIERAAGNKESIRQFAEGLGGDDAAPVAVISGLQKHYDDELNLLKNESSDIQKGQYGLAQELPKASRAEEGRKIRYALQSAKDAKSEEMTRLADDLGLNNIRATADISDLRAGLEARFVKGDFTDKYIPSVVKDLLASDDPTLGFTSYLRVRNQIGSDIGRALAYGNNTEAKSLVEVKKAFDDWAEAGFKAFPEFKNFRTRYENEFALPYEKGVAYQVLEKDSANPKNVIYQTTDERVAKAFMANERSALDFMRLFQGNETAMNSMKNAVLDDVRRNVIGNPKGPYAGTVDPNKLASYIDKNDDVLKALGMKSRLEDIQATAGDLSIRANAMENRVKAINQDEINKLLIKLGKGDTDPETVIDNAIKNAGQMSRIVNRVKELDDPNLLEALKASVVSRVLANNDIENPVQFMETLNMNRKALTQVLGPKHFEDMKIVTDAMLRAQATESGLEGAGVGNVSFLQKFEQKFGISYPSLGSRLMAAEEGRVSGKTTAFFLASRFLSNRQKQVFDKMFQQSMVDGDFSAALRENLDAATGLPPENAQRRIKAFLFNIGEPGGQDSMPSKEPEKVTIDPSGSTAPVKSPGSSAPLPPPSLGLPPASAPRELPPPPLQRQGAVAPSMQGIGSLAQSAPAGSGAPTAARGPEYAALFPHDTLGAQIAGRQ